MTILYFILAAVALGFLVFIHELGHYFAAKKTGMTVETFSIGFGKPILKWRWHDVDWQVGMLPFGGYVKIAGMELNKKDKNTYSEPYEIPNGFFSKSPLKRIFVALAGPVANFLLAIVLFGVIWAMGGREKPFSDFTQIVGWVDPQSEIYALGLRPGDILTEYNGKPYTGSKDLIYATMLAGKVVEFKGFHVDYETGKKDPFSYQIESYTSPSSIQGIPTTGVTTGARYLIYDKVGDSENPLPEGSPLIGSGLAYQDRFVWADGEYLFSMDQLSHILNAEKAFLTVQRGTETLFTRQPRIAVSELNIPNHVRNELIDWQYEMRASPAKKRGKELQLLPYVISNEGYVEAPLEFLDVDAKRTAFPRDSINQSSELPLQPGDRIVAVDGIAVDRGYQILEQIQTHRLNFIVEKGVQAVAKTSWKDEDHLFIKDIDYQAMAPLVNTLGTQNPVVANERFAFLKPVEPKSIDQFALSEANQEALKSAYEKQKQEIAKIRDSGKRAQALKVLEQNQHKLILGAALQDRRVDYNPNPLVMFAGIFTETWHTLKALVMGHLNPKWMSGPVGIVQVLHHGWTVGIKEALFWTAAISVNLGFLNLLPIPVVDGGYIFLSLGEMITRRRLKARTLSRLILPFAIFLIGLMIFLTFQDITRLF